VLAARAEHLGLVAITMLAFGIGAALPLVAIGIMSREALVRWRERMLAAGRNGKAMLGLLLAVVGVLILTGLDKRLEAALVEASPEWLTQSTTRF
jgi:cytochrome c biogenesis protein CcdA